LLKIDALALYVVWFKNYMHFNTVDSVIKDVVFLIDAFVVVAGCHTYFQRGLG
jgi:hypothetical protein